MGHMGKAAKAAMEAAKAAAQEPAQAPEPKPKGRARAASAKAKAKPAARAKRSARSAPQQEDASGERLRAKTSEIDLAPAASDDELVRDVKLMMGKMTETDRRALKANVAKFTPSLTVFSMCSGSELQERLGRLSCSSFLYAAATLPIHILPIPRPPASCICRSWID